MKDGYTETNLNKQHGSNANVVQTKAHGKGMPKKMKK